MKQVLEKLIVRQNLSQEEARSVMSRIMSGTLDSVQIGALLVALRAKGETVEEVAGFAEAMREMMTPVPATDRAIDMCGTGGDGIGTFNISTCASFVVAGAGVKVAKHGNRAASSVSGSADVMSALGVDIAMPPEKMAQCVEEIGIGFLFAPALHPAMKHAAPVRKTLAVRTVFNILGPLCNPAGVKRQVIGVFSADLTEKTARILQLLGSEEVIVAHGYDGMDEITITAPTRISHLSPKGKIETQTISPERFGLEVATLEDVKGGTPEENAFLIKDILRGKNGPRRDVVVLNAAAGIVVGGRSQSLEKGIEVARDALDSGAALEVLRKLQEA